MPIIGIIASSVSAKEVLYYTASANYTPAAYPFNYDAYIVGGGGGQGASVVTNADNFIRYGGGGGGGSGFFTFQQNITKNTGTISITVGAAGNNGAAGANGNAGGTSSVDTYNAAGGNGGARSNSDTTSGVGGNGGSGGGGGGIYFENFVNGAFSGNGDVRGGDSGGHGQNGNAAGGTGQNQNANTGNTNAYMTGNDARIPSGGSGANTGYTTNYAPTYNGITVSGTSYGSGRGRGSRPASTTSTAGGGFVIIKQN